MLWGYITDIVFEYGITKMMKRLQSAQKQPNFKQADFSTFRHSPSNSPTKMLYPFSRTQPAFGRVLKTGLQGLFEQTWIGPAVWKSKLYDGIFPALVMILLTLLFSLLFLPVEIVFGLPGLLIYTLVILAGGVFALGKCIQMRFNEITRAWYGVVSGLLLWFAVNTAGRLGEAAVSMEVQAVMLLLATLVIMTLWKTVFPVGLRFLVLVFLINWTLRFWLSVHAFLAVDFEFFRWSYYFSGFIALSALIFFLMWMFFKAESRIHHLWAAVGVWFCALLVMIIFFQMPLG